MELDKINGYKEAIAEARALEESLRDAPYLNEPHELCGVLCRHLNLRHLLLLFGAKSPFFHPGEILPEHVAQFFVIVCDDEAVRKDREVRAEFVAKLGMNVDFGPAIAEINAYLETVFMDRPASSGPLTEAATSFAANFVDEFGAAYSLRRAEVLEEPLAVLFQQLRRIERRRNQNAVFFSRFTDQVKKKFAKEWRKANPRPPKKGKGA